MNKISKKNSLVLIIVVVLILIGIWLGQGIYLPKEHGSETQTLFFIEKGQGLREIAFNLEKQGLIRSRLPFELYGVLQGSVRNLQAGKYNLTASMNTLQILSKLTQGDTIKEKITIIEGWNLRDIGWYFENKGIFGAEELFEIVAKDFSDEFDFLKEIRQLADKKVSLEGYLFPDTYEIVPEFEIGEIVRKMLQNFDEKITPELREEIASQGRTLFEVIIMASILEKEVKTYKDRQIVAGILWKRLRLGWPLQADATLTYLTGKESLNLTKDDLKIDSPYNTYKYYGLPLGPICNPGLESIRAAIYYEDSSYWFYLTTPEGETIFSGTLEEHNIARFNYLK